MSAPTPPATVLAAVAALRAAFDDIHVMHECDQNCLADCDLSDYSESAYRYHDEHNFDVRETIHDRASGLVDALEEWLSTGTGNDQPVSEESSCAAGCDECGAATDELVSPQHDLVACPGFS